MQAPLRFLLCFALQLRRSVAVLQQRPSQGYDPPPSSFGAATITKRTTKKAQSITLCAFSEN